MYYLENTMIIISATMPFLAAVAVATRFYARRLKKLDILIDDWTILLALVITTALCMNSIYATVHEGLAHPLNEIPPDLLVSYFKFLYSDIILCHLAFGIIKISVILFYKRIFTIQKFQIAANTALLIVASWTISAVLSIAFSASPISNFWNHYGQVNINFGTWSIVNSALDISLDLLTLCLPLPIIKNLHISTKKKVSLVCIFWLGGFCVATSSVRLYFSVEVGYVSGGSLASENLDYATYIANSNTLWSRIEAGASIITACLPTLAPLVHDSRPFGSLFSSLRSLFSTKSNLSSSKESNWSESRAYLHMESPRSQISSPNPKEGYTLMTGADLELGKLPAQPAKGIVVQTTISSEVGNGSQSQSSRQAVNG